MIFLIDTFYKVNIYNEVLNKPLFSFGYFVSFRGIDKGIVEMLGPYGAVTTFSSLMKKVRYDPILSLNVSNDIFH